MAKMNRKPNYQNKAFHAVGFFCIMLLVQKGKAYDFTVGGANGWSVPTDPNAQSYNQWAEANRFQIGDSLVFNYPSGQDSLLQVSQDDYNNCKTDTPIQKFSDGHTVFKFTSSGPYYFISGNKDNCLKNEKLIVIVLADRSNRSPNNNQTSTAPPPSNSTISPSPSPANGTEATPSPAPAEQSPLPSPPTGSVEIIPTPASVSEPPPSSTAASSIIRGFLGSFGVFGASSLLLASF